MHNSADCREDGVGVGGAVGGGVAGGDAGGGAGGAGGVGVEVLLHSLFQRKYLTLF